MDFGTISHYLGYQSDQAAQQPQNRVALDHTFPTIPLDLVYLLYMLSRHCRNTLADLRYGISGIPGLPADQQSDQADQQLYQCNLLDLTFPTIPLGLL